MKAVLNTNTEWVCTGTSDAIECFVYNNDQDRAVQIEAAGVAFSNATVTAYGITGASQVVELPAGTGEICSIGGDDKFLISKIKVSNLPAATYTFRFSAV